MEVGEAEEEVEEEIVLSQANISEKRGQVCANRPDSRETPSYRASPGIG